MEVKPFEEYAHLAEKKGEKEEYYSTQTEDYNLIHMTNSPAKLFDGEKPQCKDDDLKERPVQFY